MAKRVLLDTCFWFALYEARDAHHEEAMLLADDLALDNLVIPWPCLYETLNTRFVGRAERLVSFRALLRRPSVTLLHDEAYRERALASVLEPGRGGMQVSLVDAVIREMLRDLSIRLDVMVTFNERDFLDLCVARNIELFTG